VLEFVDTHCHIQSLGHERPGEEHTQRLWARAADLTTDEVLSSAQQAGVTRMICVGCTLEDSQLAVEFVQDKPACYASIGVHPHEAKDYVNSPDKLQKFRNLAREQKVVAIGECGLDYYYEHSSRANQEKILRFQLEVAAEHNLPVIFHVRDAFEDFWPIIDEFPGIKGVIHSFTANPTVLEQILKRDLFVGLNGIMTFTKDQEQLAAARTVPLSKLLLETDAPFLTPTPYRGTICQPKHVLNTAEFLAELRGEDILQLAAASTRNAYELFGLQEKA
jgi:TatD DNase family protein